MQTHVHDDGTVLDLAVHKSTGCVESERVLVWYAAIMTNFRVLILRSGFRVTLPSAGALGMLPFGFGHVPPRVSPLTFGLLLTLDFIFHIDSADLIECVARRCLFRFAHPKRVDIAPLFQPRPCRIVLFPSRVVLVRV